MAARPGERPGERLSDPLGSRPGDRLSGRPGWAPGIAALAATGQGPSPGLIRDLVGAQETRLGGEGMRSHQRQLEAGLLGLGVLAELVAQPNVTDVLVNGDGDVWLDRGVGVVRSGLRLCAEDSRALAVRLAGLAGRRLDDAQPWVDGLLPGGVRLHAILPPLVAGGAHLCLRVPRVAPDGLSGLVAIGAIPETAVEVLQKVIDARLTFLVVGGTGTGKTTLVGGLLAACAPGDRIVIVEDVRELTPRHPHLVQLQGRSPNVEGVGGVSMVDLVRQALRMRPDRLVVGEVRGGEVRELLAALNTGHRGGGGTVHANSIHDVPARLEALGALAGMTARAVAGQVLGGLDVVLGMRRQGQVRQLIDLGVVRPDHQGRPEVVAALDLSQASPRWGPGADALDALLADQARR